MSFLSCEKCGINKVENEKKMDKLTKMSEADEIIRKLNTEQRDYLNRYFAHARDSLFLKIPRDSFEKWILKDVDALQMETERIIGYLLDQSRKERLYVLLPGNERVYLILTNLYETYGKFDTYSVYMSRKDFSEVTGLSERTITRALKELEEKKLITRNGWNIVMTWNQYNKIKKLMKDQINEMGE